ncbi:MAG: serine hydrolase domain-containing protein [Spirosomataceae bacterium]
MKNSISHQNTSLRILVVLLLLTHSGFAQLSARIDSLLQTYAKPDEPGFAVLVMHKGKVVLEKGYGLANIETNTTINPETNFRMASVSKQFTAMAIALLHQQGKLSFDDPLSKFFPEFNPNVGQQVRLRHILTHTSGLVDYENLIPDARTQQVLDADVLDVLKTQDSTYFKPGSTYRYSNSGFCLLAMVVERVAKMPFEAFVSQYIFKPVGMKASFLYSPTQPQTNRAMGYARNEQGQLIASDQSVTSATKGDGCVYTSLRDYVKWNNALITNRFIKLEEEVRRMALPIDKQRSYGLGWFVAKRADGRLEFSHTGSTCGFSNLVLRIPSEQLLVVYFSNIAGNTQPYKALFKLFQATPAFPKAHLWDVEALTR